MRRPLVAGTATTALVVAVVGCHACAPGGDAAAGAGSAGSSGKGGGAGNGGNAGLTGAGAAGQAGAPSWVDDDTAWTPVVGLPNKPPCRVERAIPERIAVPPLIWNGCGVGCRSTKPLMASGEPGTPGGAGVVPSHPSLGLGRVAVWTGERAAPGVSLYRLTDPDEGRCLGAVRISPVGCDVPVAVFGGDLLYGGVVAGELTYRRWGKLFGSDGITAELPTEYVSSLRGYSDNTAVVFVSSQLIRFPFDGSPPEFVGDGAPAGSWGDLAPDAFLMTRRFPAGVLAFVGGPTLMEKQPPFVEVANLEPLLEPQETLSEVKFAGSKIVVPILTWAGAPNESAVTKLRLWIADRAPLGANGAFTPHLSAAGVPAPIYPVASEGFVAFESVNMLAGGPNRWPVWRIVRLSDHAMFDAPRPADAWLGSAALTDTEFFVVQTEYQVSQVRAVMRYDLSKIDQWGVPPAP